MKSLPPKAVNAKGCYIYDSTGKAYLDGSGGAAVSCLGHGDPDIIMAVQKQAEALSFAHTGFFTSEPAEELADILVHHAPEGLDRVYLKGPLCPLRLKRNSGLIGFFPYLRIPQPLPNG